MAINASSITTSNTLEQLRQEFNNLVTDVSGLEAGTTTFSAVTATTTNTTTINVLEDGTIIFEGATDDGNETTLTVEDPTADRTITLPDESGTVLTSASTVNATTMTISANNLTVDAAADITLDAGGADVVLKDDGTQYASFTNSSGDLIVKSGSTTMLTGSGANATFAGTITTTGLITGGSLDIDDVVVNGSTIGHTDDTDLITVADGIVTVAGEISVTTLDIGGTNVTSTAAELNILDGVTATASELNLLDGDTSVGSSITLVDADGVVVNDGGTMKTIPASDVKTYASGSSATKGFAIAAAIVFG